MSYRATVTNSQITLVIDGNMHTFNDTHLLYPHLRKAVARKADVDEIRKIMSPGGLVAHWSGGRFFLNQNEQVADADGPIPPELSRRIMEMIRVGNSPSSIFKFWSRLKQNPSHRSVTQLWGFLQHSGIPITDSGYLLAYKSVQEGTLLDHHSSTFENRPGKVLAMPRNQVSDDPRTPCHEGFHVGALKYAGDFGSGRTIVICKVDPIDVVSVPYDCDAMKMRVCRYEVVGFYTGAMDNNLVLDEDLPDNTDVTIVVEDKDQEKAAQKIEVKEVSRQATDKILAMDMDELRRFARQDLKIVGANKMEGGKLALLELVLSNLARKGK